MQSKSYLGKEDAHDRVDGLREPCVANEPGINPDSAHQCNLYRLARQCAPGLGAFWTDASQLMRSPTCSGEGDSGDLLCRDAEVVLRMEGDGGGVYREWNRPRPQGVQLHPCAATPRDEVGHLPRCLPDERASSVSLQYFLVSLTTEKNVGWCSHVALIATGRNTCAAQLAGKVSQAATDKAGRRPPPGKDATARSSSKFVQKMAALSPNAEEPTTSVVSWPICIKCTLST